MESQQNEQNHQDTGARADVREDEPFGSSRGEVITMIAFGIMAIGASVCFVIW